MQELPKHSAPQRHSFKTLECWFWDKSFKCFKSDLRYFLLLWNIKGNIPTQVVSCFPALRSLKGLSTDVHASLLETANMTLLSEINDKVQKVSGRWKGIDKWREEARMGRIWSFCLIIYTFMIYKAKCLECKRTHLRLKLCLFNVSMNNKVAKFTIQFIIYFIYSLN